MESRWNRHGDRLFERHGMRVWRLGIDAGFSCPHRENGRGRGGCRFCSPEAGLAAYQHEGQRTIQSLDEQISRAIGFTSTRYEAGAFFLYFQAYSCTNLPVDELRAVYERAISLVETIAPKTLRGLVVSTRPDCFSKDKADLLEQYRQSGLEVWLELGLQSSNNNTLARIRRGHSADSYREAAELAGRAGLKRACHVILGLPGEGRSDMLATLGFAAECGLEGIKFHNLRLVKGSSLERTFQAGELALMHPSRLPSLLADCLEVLPLHIEVMRLSADFDKGQVLDVFPPFEKFRLHRAVEMELERRDSRQGGRYGILDS
jgi:radical SAM protein (TIGR01212 family)